MIKLQIRRKTAKVWQHFITDGENFIFSKCYCKTNGDKFRVVEDGGTAKNEYNFDEIEVYDDLNAGSAETFTSSLLLMERLSALQYVGFNKDGDVVIADLISSDSSNALIEGTDGRLYVPTASAGGVESVSGSMVDNTDPLSPIIESDSTKQDNLNAINLGQIIYDELAIKSTPSADDEIVMYDSITGEAVTAKFSSFQQVEKYPIKYLYQATGVGLGTYGTNVLVFQGTQSDVSPANGLSYRKVVSSTTAGTTIFAREGSFLRVAAGSGFELKLRFRFADASTISDVRFFHGLQITSGFVNTDISANTQVMCGIGADGADTNIHVFSRQTTFGALVKTDTGFSKTLNHEYVLHMTREKGTNQVNILLKNLTLATEFSTSVTNNTTALTIVNHRNNNASTLSCGFEIQREELNLSE